MQIGIAGELRCVIKNKQNRIINDTGFQKNLILNQGLDFFGGGKGTSIFNSCVIGAGNSVPVATQTTLDSILAMVSGSQDAHKYDYVPDASNLYKVNKTWKFIFSNLGNVNVAEVGLSSQGSTLSNYYLCTRALIKDAAGNPTVISIKTDETLEIYYKVWSVISVLDVDYIVNQLDGGNGTPVPFNVRIRPAQVGTPNWKLENPAELGTITRVNTADLSEITSEPATTSDLRSIQTMDSYVPNSYKRVGRLTLSPAQANHTIKTVVNYNSFFFFQVRYGAVTNNSPINKTSNHTLTLPFEFSWGRYEGAL